MEGIIREIVRKVLREQNNAEKRASRLISETKFRGKTIISVDIQPEYANSIPFLREWANFINKSAKSNKIVFLYNGADTLGMIDEGSYKEWLMFDVGIDEDVVYNATFYDKGYAFFRYCMDNSIDERNIADLVKFMVRHNINDSREINEDMWNAYMEETGHSQQDVRDLLETAGDCIHIPDLMDFLQSYSNIVLMGGGVDECLKEVEIALLALDKPHNVLSQFVY